MIFHSIAKFLHTCIQILQMVVGPVWQSSEVGLSDGGETSDGIDALWGSNVNLYFVTGTIILICILYTMRSVFHVYSIFANLCQVNLISIVCN